MKHLVWCPQLLTTARCDDNLPVRSIRAAVKSLFEGGPLTRVRFLFGVIMGLRTVIFVDGQNFRKNLQEYEFQSVDPSVRYPSSAWMKSISFGVTCFSE